MIFKRTPTKEGAGVIVNIESESTMFAYQTLWDTLSSFFAKKGKVLQEKRYEQGVTRNQKKRWSLAVIEGEKIAGRVNITHELKLSGSSLKQHMGKGWTEYKFLVYFEDFEDKIQFRNQFLKY